MVSAFLYALLCRFLCVVNRAIKRAIFCAVVIYIVNFLMFSITANELKRNGVASIERVMQGNNETAAVNSFSLRSM
jgi:hypothetical protein